MIVSLKNIIIRIGRNFSLRSLEIMSKKYNSKHSKGCVASLVVAISLVGMKPALAGNIIFDSDFETGKIQGWQRADGKIPGAIAVQSNTVRAGKYAVKLHMKRCSWVNPLCTPRPVGLNRPRASLHRGGRLALPLNQSMWLGYSIFFPNDFKPTREMVAGVGAHNSAGGPGDCQKTGAAQPFSFRLSGSRYLMRSTTETAPAKWRQFDLATVQRGQWMDVVMNWKWSYGSDGFFKIWINGKPKVDFKGSTLCRATQRLNNGGGLPYLNAANYYAGWTKHDSSIKSLTLYFDEIRVGGSSASYRDLAPHGVAKASASFPAQKANTAAKKTPVAKKKTTSKKKINIRVCNKHKGKKRVNCRRRVRKHNRSMKR